VSQFIVTALFWEPQPTISKIVAPALCGARVRIPASPYGWINFGVITYFGSFMYSTYILKSVKTGKYYYGSSIDVERRLKEHNAGGMTSTRSGRPWVIHFVEQHSDKAVAVKRELFFKKRSGYKWLKEQAII